MRTRGTSLQRRQRGHAHGLKGACAVTISERRLAPDPVFDKTIVPLPVAAQPPPNMGEICPPTETADRICRWSRAKAALPLQRLLSLGGLGGLYIGLGGALATLAMSESSLGIGPTRWLGGLAFSLGLILVVMGGAELSTGNCLMAISRLRGATTGREIWRNWSWSYAANAAGALALAWLVVLSGIYDAEPLHRTAIRIAETKLALPAPQAFARGVLANMLVCFAVWLATTSQSATGKVVGIMFPISAFVALGFEHSIANLYLIPVGMMVGASGTTLDLVRNITAVTAGNLVGGAIVAGGLLWFGHGHVTELKPTRSN
jgi:formate/nitrite transporter